jgi:hypothetical protein
LKQIPSQVLNDAGAAVPAREQHQPELKARRRPLPRRVELDDPLDPEAGAAYQLAARARPEMIERAKPWAP